MNQESQNMLNKIELLTDQVILLQKNDYKFKSK
jgi:hypothetical protein